MNYNNFDKIRRLRAKMRELENKLETGNHDENEFLIVAEIDRLEKEIMRLEEGRSF